MKTTQELYEQMLADYEAATGFAMQDSCDLAVRLYAAAAQLETLDYYADWSRKQAFPQTATGEYLDYHGQMRCLSRKGSAYATGELTFYVPAALSYDLVIPAGTVVSTTGLTRFVTTAACLISAGSLSGTCPARAELPGTAGNIGAGQANCLTNAPFGVSACNNSTPFTGGAEEEDDEAFRSRILASYRCASNGGNAAFYEATALACPGVAACSVLAKNRGVGTVDVVIATETGAPEDSLINALQTELEQKRELCVDVAVLSPTTVTVSVAAVLWPSEGVRFDDAKTAVAQAIHGFFTGRLLGKSVYRSTLGNLIYNTGLVKNYALTLPAADCAVAASELPVLGQLTLTEGE